jgi:hypothetical protein
MNLFFGLLCVVLVVTINFGQLCFAQEFSLGRCPPFPVVQNFDAKRVRVNFESSLNDVTQYLTYFDPSQNIDSLFINEAFDRRHKIFHLLPFQLRDVIYGRPLRYTINSIFWFMNLKTDDFRVKLVF